MPQAVQDEFKAMVKLLHAAGLEVILDVVYNHTAEGGADGQTLSFRGLGEKQYYRTDGHGKYVDTTGLRQQPELRANPAWSSWSSTRCATG